MRMQVHSGKPHGPRVPQDVSEGDAASPALRGVHPVAAPGILNRVPISAIPDVKTVERMKRNGQPDAKQFQKEHQRQIRQKAHLAGISIRSGDGGRVRDQNMLEQERPHANTPRKEKHPPQNKRNAPTRAQRRYAVRYGLTRSRRTGRYHETLLMSS